MIGTVAIVVNALMTITPTITPTNIPKTMATIFFLLISHLPQAGILNPLVKNNKANTNEINQIVIKKTDLVNLVDCDFLTKNSAMPVTMNEGMSDVKNNNPRSNELISWPLIP